jgi:uncharacterized RDD family membrane protein YckC
MTYGPGTTYSGQTPYQVDLRLTEGVLGRRFLAYLIDLVIIAILMALLWIVIALFGVITFGFGWALFALLPLTAIAYNALTIGGVKQATVGMRATGIRVVDALNGGPVPIVTAAVHALLFYVAASTFVLWALDILIGMVRNDSRLGHDILTGVILIRSS